MPEKAEKRFYFYYDHKEKILHFLNNAWYVAIIAEIATLIISAVLFVISAHNDTYHKHLLIWGISWGIVTVLCILIAVLSQILPESLWEHYYLDSWTSYIEFPIYFKDKYRLSFIYCDDDTKTLITEYIQKPFYTLCQMAKRSKDTEALYLAIRPQIYQLYLSLKTSIITLNDRDEIPGVKALHGQNLKDNIQEINAYIENLAEPIKKQCRYESDIKQNKIKLTVEEAEKTMKDNFAYIRKFNDLLEPDLPPIPEDESDSKKKKKKKHKRH